jgi:hypothetical protein
MLIVDNIDPRTRSWLAMLANLYYKSKPTAAIPADVFEGIQARGWVTGMATSCQLTQAGLSAIDRLFTREEIVRAFKPAKVTKTGGRRAR